VDLVDMAQWDMMHQLHRTLQLRHNNIAPKFGAQFSPRRTAGTHFIVSPGFLLSEN